MLKQDFKLSEISLAATNLALNLGQLNPKTFYMLENLFNIRDKQNHSKQ
jgi:hypothetical protein